MVIGVVAGNHILVYKSHCTSNKVLKTSFYMLIEIVYLSYHIFDWCISSEATMINKVVNNKINKVVNNKRILLLSTSTNSE